MVVVSLFSTEPTARLAVQKVFNGSCVGKMDKIVECPYDKSTDKLDKKI